MNFTFEHFNFNVTDLAKSLTFYDRALGFKEVRRLQADDGSFIIVYLSDGNSNFELELTWLKEHPQKYDLGENEFHLALRTDKYQDALRYHQEAGWVCLINEDMGIYFIEDPDGYWIEILPPR